MSWNSDRKMLIAKRRHERLSGSLPATALNNISTCIKPNFDDEETRRGTKRIFTESPSSGLKKNLANDRMKRLRTKLAEVVTNNGLESVKKNNVQMNKTPRSTFERRKRSFNSRRTSSEEVIQKKFYTVNNNEQTVVKSGLSLPTSEVFRPPQIQSSSYENSINIPTTQNNSTWEGFKTYDDSIWNHAAAISESSQTASEQVEQMEWSTGDVSDTSAVPETLKVYDTVNTKEPTNSQNKTNFYIVTDTNIFISHMDLVKELTEISLSRSSVPVVFIPWIVIEELDYLKGDSGSGGCKWKAQEAIKFINTALESKNGRIIGQTLTEVSTQRDTGKNPDDKIIACCLQVMENFNNMILLSNDVNLKNKALINNIPTCSHNEILSKISPKVDVLGKSQQILEKMIVLCSTVIQNCAFRAYGKNWKKMGLLESSPKSMKECVKIFRKYWIAVFKELLLKQFQNAVDDFASFLAKNGNLLDNPSQIGKLSDLCIRICIFLKDIDHCKNLVESTIRDIAQIKDS